MKTREFRPRSIGTSIPDGGDATVQRHSIEPLRPAAHRGEMVLRRRFCDHFPVLQTVMTRHIDVVLPPLFLRTRTAKTPRIDAVSSVPHAFPYSKRRRHNVSTPFHRYLQAIQFLFPPPQMTKTRRIDAVLSILPRLFYSDSHY